MNKTIRNLIAGIALLLIALSLPTAVILTAPPSARADPGVLYTAPSAVGSGSCSSWANACTLQTALTNAVNGDEIWTKAGVHYPGSNRTDTFALQSGVAVYGGFAGTETARDQRDWTANLTVLSGDIDQNDLTDPTGVVTNTLNISGTNSYHVVSSSGVTETAVLDGFIVTAGQANGQWSGAAPCDACGGGMYNEGGGPTVANLAFSGNTSNWGGGGMFNSGSSPALAHVTFSNNTSNSGGGMFNYHNTHPTLTAVTFIGNSTADSGGGMFNSFANPTLINVTFISNSSLGSGGGGGMRNSSSSSPTLTNVTFSGNSSIFGSELHNDDSSPTLTNVILWSNGAGLWNYNSTPHISYSDIQGCGGSGSWNSACGTDHGGNIEADPLFVDAASGNLRLVVDSPAVDTGTTIGVPTTDIDGNPRDYLPDMGAYEYQWFRIYLPVVLMEFGP